MSLELSDEELRFCADAIDAWYSEFSVGDDWSQRLALRDKIRDHLLPEYGPPNPVPVMDWVDNDVLGTARSERVVVDWRPGESVPRGQTGSTLGT